MFQPEPVSEAIVRDAAAGQTDAGRRLVAALAPHVRAMVIVRLAPNALQMSLIDDLTQQALTDVLAGLAGLSAPTGDALRSFTSTVVSRRVADFIRAPVAPNDRPMASLESSIGGETGTILLRDLISASGLSPRSEAAQHEQTRQLLHAVSELKPDYREAITLAFIDQVPPEQLAERLQRSRAAASMLVLRATKALRRALTGSSKVLPAHDRSA